jgi:hypothetical protein
LYLRKPEHTALIKLHVTIRLTETENRILFVQYLGFIATLNIAIIVNSSYSIIAN